MYTLLLNQTEHISKQASFTMQSFYQDFNWTDNDIRQIASRFHNKKTLVKWAWSQNILGKLAIVERLQEIDTEVHYQPKGTWAFSEWKWKSLLLQFDSSYNLRSFLFLNGIPEDKLIRERLQYLDLFHRSGSSPVSYVFLFHIEFLYFNLLQKLIFFLLFFQEESDHITQYMVDDIINLFYEEDRLLTWSVSERCLNHPSVVSRLAQIRNGMVNQDSEVVWKEKVDKFRSVEELDRFLDDYSIPKDGYVMVKRDQLECDGMIRATKKVIFTHIYIWTC